MKKLFIITFILLCANYIFAQNVGINSDGSAPDPSAILDIKATDAGLLIPRVDLDDASTATPITSPATGLMIYNQGGDETDGFYFWNGSAWTMLNSTMEGSGTTDYVARWTPDGSTLGTGLIRDDGSNVAINAAPNGSYTLYNNGATGLQGLVQTGSAIELSGLGSGDRTTYIDFHSQDATDYNFRIIRGSGANGITQFEHKGTTQFRLFNWDAAPMVFSTNSLDRMRILSTGEVGINTTTPGSYQTKIVGATGNSGLDVYKMENADGVSFNGINVETYNSHNSDKVTTGLKATVSTLQGETYGVRGIIEHNGTQGNYYSVAGEHWNWNQTTLNSGGYLGYQEKVGGPKGYRGFIGVLGHVNDNNGYASVYNSYGGYFHNEMNSNDNTEDKYGVYAEVDAQSFTSGDGTESWGLFASSTNTDNIYGIVGQARLNHWFNQNKQIGVAGQMSNSSGTTVYTEGWLGYNGNGGGDVTGMGASCGVVGLVNTGNTNNSESTIAGFFKTEHSGSGSRTASNYGLYATSEDADANAASKNYGIYAKASGAVSNYSGFFAGQNFIAQYDDSQIMTKFYGGNGGGVRLRLVAHGGTYASKTATVSGNKNIIQFAGYQDASTEATGAAIIGQATENWSGSQRGMYLEFRTTENGGTSTTEKMRIDHDGQVGINITSPGYQLHVDGNFKVGNSNGAADRAVNMMYIGDGSYIQIGEWEADDKLSFKASSYNFTNGDVGINTTSPDAQLDVEGDFKLGTNGTVIANIIKTTVNQDIVAHNDATYWTETFTVIDAATGSSVIVSPNGVLTDGVFILYSWVSAANTVSVRFLNNSGGVWNPAAQDYYITVIE